ncbi:sporulation protein [Heliobacterium gestii]|uniref:Sporulation protein n=1 Tax=Heliomicrobium gestii TaxID=2699 RepID=A0A845LJ06_HELGE|nr:sporulation protein [Heliomicrobium gestii]MBM7868084.1 sporulation-control protein [Heliomicrobium gestii]MZP44385.1 sporulation protein [Heliomicrobium gestii]
MSFFKKALASIGIGSAKVDAVFHTLEATAGSEVSGVIQIRGGSVAQHIDKISLMVMTEYEKELEDRKVTEYAQVQKEQIRLSLDLQPGEEREIPFSFCLSPYTPVSIGQTPVWVQTELEVDMAIDPSDRDHLQVRPHLNMAAVMDAVEQLGFRMYKVKNEASYAGPGIPFIQNFEYKPTSHFQRRLDELEVAYLPHPGGIDLLLEIDRKARTFAGYLEEAADMDESRVRLSLSQQEIDQGTRYIAERLKEVIDDFS